MMRERRKDTAGQEMPAEVMTGLKDQLVTLRGLHLQARAIMLAAQRIAGAMKADEQRFDDFAAVAYALADLNIAMGKAQSELLDRIDGVERARKGLH